MPNLSWNLNTLTNMSARNVLINQGHGSPDLVLGRVIIIYVYFFLITPWKINMEHINHPFRKENDLNQTSMIMFHVNLQGCIQGPAHVAKCSHHSASHCLEHVSVSDMSPGFMRWHKARH